MDKSNPSASLEIDDNSEAAEHIDDEKQKSEPLIAISSSKSSNNKLLSILLYSLGSMMFGLMTVTCKMAYYSNPNLSGLDYMLVRSGAMVVFATFPMVGAKVNPLNIEKKYYSSLAAMCILGCIAMPCFFIALKFVPTTKSSVMFSFNPIIISLLGVIFMNEAISSKSYMCIIGAFIGMCLLAASKTDSEFHVSYKMQIIGLLMCFI